MRVYDSLTIADTAVSGNPDRAATAIILDAPDARLVAFRLSAGQEVPMHSSTSTVILSVVSGTGVISGRIDGTIHDREVGVGAIVAYEPGELHGMRALNEVFVVIATITPRPGSRKTAVA